MRRIDPRWAGIAQEEQRKRQRAINVRPLSEIQRRTPHGALRQRFDDLFAFFGLPPDAAGYRKLLCVILAECEIRIPAANANPVQRLDALRRPNLERTPSPQKAKSASDVIDLARQLTDPSYCWSGFPGDTSVRLSQAQAIGVAVRHLNDAAEVDDLLNPDAAPHARITEAALKKALQRASSNKAMSSDHQDRTSSNGPVDWQKALEVAAPRADEWVDQIGLAIGACRAGKLTTASCAELAGEIVRRHLNQQEKVSQ